MANITQKQLDDFKKLYPLNRDIQSLTLATVLQNTAGKTVNWNTLTFSDQPSHPTTMGTSKVAITSCQKAIGFVVFDAVCLAFGAVGLRSSVKPATIEAIAVAAAPVLSKIETTIARISAEGASSSQQAWGVFEILKTIFNGGCFGAVMSAFMSSLTWWDMILYGITGTATIIAALATDGLAFAAEVAIVLASTGFLVSDSVKAVQACNLPGPSPEFTAALVRQDFSDCLNSNVHNVNPATAGGTVTVMRNANGTYSASVTLVNSTPNTNYHFFLKCVQQLGNVHTDQNGQAAAVFQFSAALVGAAFAFDMYPDGAPTGNKFQSEQVRF
jgi:hypothetical protein